MKAEVVSGGESNGELPAASVDARELARARTIFDDMASKTYNVDLKDLTPDDWSFSPSFGSVVVVTPGMN